MLSSRFSTSTLALLVSATVLGGCSSDKSAYPSLARRPVERIANDPAQADPAPPPLPAPSPAALAARLDSLVDAARGAHERFRTRRVRAEQLVAAAGGSAVSSEAWSVATIALADLESARSEAMVTLADLDALLAADRVANAVTGGGSAPDIAAARDKVIALVGEEDAVLAGLRSRMAS